MASITSNPLSLSSSSSSTLIDVKAPRQSAAASSQCVTLPTLPPSLALSQSRPRKTTASCDLIDFNIYTCRLHYPAIYIYIYIRTLAELFSLFICVQLHAFVLSGQKIAGNVVAMATAEAPAEVAATELPDIVRTVQEAWDKVEEKYAVSSLAVAGVVALWGSTGMISAIDRLPFIPGVLELVGIGYTGVQAPFMFGLTKALLSTDLNHPIDDDHDFKRIKSC